MAIQNLPANWTRNELAQAYEATQPSTCESKNAVSDEELAKFVEQKNAAWVTATLSRNSAPAGNGRTQGTGLPHHPSQYGSEISETKTQDRVPEEIGPLDVQADVFQDANPINALRQALDHADIRNLPDNTPINDVFRFNNNTVFVNKSNTPASNQEVCGFINRTMDQFTLHNGYSADDNLMTIWFDGQIPDKLTLEDLRDINEAGHMVQALGPTKAERRHEMRNLLAAHQIVIPAGVTTCIGQAADDKDQPRNLYHYQGVVFRGDTRHLDTIIQTGGFTSQEDLSIAENQQEAQGIRSDGRGATGRSGVSSAKSIELAYDYAVNENNRAKMFVIDTRTLPEGEQAYDMSATVLNNAGFGRDDTGNEVNITFAPVGAIIGCIGFSPELSSYQAPTFTPNPNYNGNPNG